MSRASPPKLQRLWGLLWCMGYRKLPTLYQFWCFKRLYLVLFSQYAKWWIMYSYVSRPTYMMVNYSFYIFDCKKCDVLWQLSKFFWPFGCIGVNHGKHAIMNKAYGQQEYETLSRINHRSHEKLLENGGNFSHSNILLIPYEDTAAQDWVSLSQSEVEKRWWWRWGWDVNKSVKYVRWKPLHISQYDRQL